MYRIQSVVWFHEHDGLVKNWNQNNKLTKFIYSMLFQSAFVRCADKHRFRKWWYCLFRPELHLRWYVAPNLGRYLEWLVWLLFDAKPTTADYSFIRDTHTIIKLSALCVRPWYILVHVDRGGDTCYICVCTTDGIYSQRHFFSICSWYCLCDWHSIYMQRCVCLPHQPTSMHFVGQIYTHLCWNES